MMISQREIDALKRNLPGIRGVPEKAIERALHEVKLAAWRRIGGDHSPRADAFPVNCVEPVLAYFPGGKSRPAVAQIVERFDGWTPFPILWQPLVMPLLVSGAVKQPIESEIVLPSGSG